MRWTLCLPVLGVLGCGTPPVTSPPASLPASPPTVAVEPVNDDGSAIPPEPASAPRIAAPAPHPLDPPEGMVRCAEFVNTDGDDIDERFFERCEGARRLVVRVLSHDGEIEEQVDARDITHRVWPNFDYLGTDAEPATRRFWGRTTLFTTTDGRDACMKQAAPDGIVLGSGYASTPVIAPANRGADEYRLSCGGEALPGRRIILYRERAAVIAE